MTNLGLWRQENRLRSRLILSDGAVMDVFSFPDEILSIIFEYVPQLDLVRSRLVSERWKEKVDALASFRIKLNDSQPQRVVDRMLGLRVRFCEIVHLKLPFTGTFQNPLFVKEIVFTNSSKENVITLLRTCEDLEKIAFFTTFVGDKFFDLDGGCEELYRLKKLKEIEIGIQVFNSKGSDKSSVFETLCANPQLTFPSLRRLFVHYPMCGVEWTNVFQFIARHTETLKCLKLRCFECPQGMSEVSPIIVKQLTKLNLVTLEIICNCSCNEYSPVHHVFSELVASQDSLQALTLDFHKCPLQSIKDVIHKSSGSLRRLKLSQLEYGIEDDLQGSMFSKCFLLSELKLHCLPRVIVYVYVLDPPTSNVPPKPIAKGAETYGWCFPKCLRRFSIKGCHIPTDELIDMGCNNLEHLELLEIGTSDSFGYGLTFHAFLNLCERLQNLESFSFRSVSFSGPEKVEEETARWQASLEAGQQVGVYSNSVPPCDYLDLNRVIRNNGQDSVGVDLTRLFTFRFHSSAQQTLRPTFLKRVNELVSTRQPKTDDGITTGINEMKDRVVK